MPILEVGDIALDVQRSGSGAPLLLIMGMSGTQEHWGEPFLEALQSDFQLITYDHRGVGRSSRLDGPFTIADLAADAGDLLRALSVDRAHVLGFSMGGMVAQELALASPELIDTLTLASTYCGGIGSALMGQQALRMLGEAWQSRERERVIAAAWQLNVSAAFAADPQAGARFREIGMRSGVAVPVIMQQMRAIADHDTSDRLHQIAAPTLVVHGTEDQMLPALNGALIADRIPGARLQILQGLGHLFFWEQPERAAALIAEHAARSAS